MRRRAFITLLGGAALAPVAAQAQQPAMPVIGLLNGVSNDAYADRIAAIRQGLKDSGFVEGQNLTIEYRSADGHAERVQELVTDLVRRQLALIFAIGTSTPARALKAATSTIPIVFVTGNDPIDTELVTSWNKPEANLTGITLNTNTLSAKRLELLHELIPQARAFSFLVNPGLSASSEEAARDLAGSARALGLELTILRAGTDQQIVDAFAEIAQQRIGGLVVMNDAYLTTRAARIVALAASHGVPTVYGSTEYVAAGGLMTYAPKFVELYRQAGPW